MDAQTPVFTFKRVERNCLYNKTRRTKDKPLYDFDVLVDGVRVAKWRRWLEGRREYVLYDLGGDRVRDEHGSSRKPVAKTQAEFADVTAKWLFHIPSPEQVEEREMVRAEQEAAEDRERTEADRIYRIEQAGPSLLAALKAMVLAYREPETTEQDEAHALATRAMLEAVMPEGENGGM